MIGLLTTLTFQIYFFVPALLAFYDLVVLNFLAVFQMSNSLSYFYLVPSVSNFLFTVFHLFSSRYCSVSHQFMELPETGIISRCTHHTECLAQNRLIHLRLIMLNCLVPSLEKFKLVALAVWTWPKRS